MRPDLVLRSPVLLIYVLFISLVMMPVGLRGAIGITSRSATPVRTGVTYIGLLVVAWILFVAVMVAVSRPARFSATGLRTYVTHPFRYDVDVRWDEIDRVWLAARRPYGPAMMIRLKDPEGVAAHRRVLRSRMRSRRARTGADVVVVLSGLRPGTDVIDSEMRRRSGGLHTLQPLPFNDSAAR